MSNASMTAEEIRTAAAEALEASSDYRDNVCVMWEGVNASSPTKIFGRKGWTSTPFQNANGGPLKVARWLWSQGGCPSYIADLNSDGSAAVYAVEFAEESDEEGTGVIAGEPLDLTRYEDVDAPETDETDSDE